MLEADCTDRPGRTGPAGRRHPFLEASLRVPPTRTNGSEATALGRQTAFQAGLPQGRLQRQRAGAEAPQGAASTHTAGLAVVD